MCEYRVMTPDVQTNSRNAFLSAIKHAISLYAHGDKRAAQDAYNTLARRMGKSSLLKDDALLNLYLETEFLVDEHGSTTLEEVVAMYRHATGEDL